MDFYKHKRIFIDRIYNYFQLATATTYINNTTKQRVYLTGKLDKTRFLMYLLFCIFFILIGSTYIINIPYIGKFILFLKSKFALILYGEIIIIFLIKTLIKSLWED